LRVNFKRKYRRAPIAIVCAMAARSFSGDAGWRWLHLGARGGFQAIEQIVRFLRPDPYGR